MTLLLILLFMDTFSPFLMSLFFIFYLLPTMHGMWARQGREETKKARQPERGLGVDLFSSNGIMPLLCLNLSIR